MYVTSLLSNIKQEIPVERSLSKFTIISGPNGSGKTSVVNALQYCLTGKIDDLSLRDGVKDTSLLLTLAPPTEPDRIFASVKLSDGSKVHRELNRIDGTARRDQPATYPSHLATMFEDSTSNDLIFPYRLIRDLLTSGAASRRAAFFRLAAPETSSEDIADLKRLGGCVEYRVKESDDVSEVLDEITTRLKDSRKKLKRVKKEIEADLILNQKLLQESFAGESLEYLEAETETIQSRIHACRRAQYDLNAGYRQLKHWQAEVSGLLAAKEGALARLSAISIPDSDTCFHCGRHSDEYVNALSRCQDVKASIQDIEDKLTSSSVTLKELTEAFNEELKPHASYEEKFDSISAVETRLAEVESGLRNKVVQMHSLTAKVQQLRMSLSEIPAKLNQVNLNLLKVKELRNRLIDSVVETYTNRVNQYLPPHLRFGIRIGAGKVGFMAGLEVGDHIRSSLSGAETAILTVAMALAIGSKFPNQLRILDLPDRDIDDDNFGAILSPFLNCSDCQIIITTTRRIAVDPPGWTVLRLEKKPFIENSQTTRVYNSVEEYGEE